jgi:DNA polymerase alpha-associated DNA helicase A
MQLALMARAMKDAFPGIELGSVDGFQGREKEAVIVSLVRSNSEHEVGFLGEKRRLNGMVRSKTPSKNSAESTTVAMTRPRRSLAVIGDSETLQCVQTISRAKFVD